MTPEYTTLFFMAWSQIMAVHYLPLLNGVMLTSSTYISKIKELIIDFMQNNDIQKASIISDEDVQIVNT